MTHLHEHVFINLAIPYVYTPPREASKIPVSESPVRIDILGVLHRNPTICRDNLLLVDEETATKELMEFKKWGGNSLVCQSGIGLGRDPVALRRVSEATNLNILTVTGWYVESSHPPYVKQKRIDELADIAVKELTEGIGETGIKAGLIGECGCSEPPPFTEQEKKVLQAASRAQERTGVAFTFHPALYDTSKRLYGEGLEVADAYLQVIRQEDADLTKFFLSHADFTCRDLDYHRRLLDKGIALSYDCFGVETYLDGRFVGARNPNDAERIKAVVELCRQGYDKQIVLSHDVCMKIFLKKYGGYGYSHVLEHIMPTLKVEGVSDKQIRNMLMENPKKILTV